MIPITHAHTGMRTNTCLCLGVRVIFLLSHILNLNFGNVNAYGLVISEVLIVLNIFTSHFKKAKIGFAFCEIFSLVW